MSRFQALGQGMFAPRDPLALQLFRIIYGATISYFILASWLSGVLASRYLEPQFFFVHISWLKPLSDEGFRGLFLALIVAGITLGAGVWTRFSASVILFGFSYLWLLEKSIYKNHYYFISLLALLFVVTGVTNVRKEVPFWKLGVFRFQVLVVYFFAGVAKMYPDWLGAIPLSVWFSTRARKWDLPWLDSEPVVLLASHGAMYLDLFAPVFLLWAPGRRIYVPLLIGFHLANNLLFSIGVFPYLMLATLLLFVDLRAFQRRLKPLQPGPRTSGQGVALICLFLVFYSAFQLVLPLRHYFVPGETHWTSEAHWFAWRMMLRTRVSYGCQFYLERPGEGRVRLQEAGRELSPKQYRDMVRTPNMLLQYARHLAEKHDGTVYVRNRLSVNRGPAQTLIDPNVGFTAAGPTQPRYILPKGRRVQPLEIPAWAVRWHGAVFLIFGLLIWSSTRGLARLFLVLATAPAFLLLSVPWLWLGFWAFLGLGLFETVQKRYLVTVFSLAATVPMAVALAFLTGSDFTIVN